MATNHTPALRLNLPLFDQDPWDTDVNDNWQILDSAIGQFFAIPNFVGIWKNSTQFLAGQVVFDATDGSQWTAQITHTSAATPTTFANDRLQHPTFWTQTAKDAAGFAQQAAQSAAQAALSASNAATSATNSANSAAVSANKVPLAGGTMTGPLILSGDPAAGAPLGAATKQYVDARVGGTGFLPLTGGTLTGALNLAAPNPTVATQATHKAYVDQQDNLQLFLAGGTMTGALILPAAAPTNPNQATNKAYVDQHVAAAAFLPLTGGVLSGGVDATVVRSSTGRIISFHNGVGAALGTQASVSMWNVNGGRNLGFWNQSNTGQLGFGDLDAAGNPSAGWGFLRNDGLFLLDSSFAMFQIVIAPPASNAGVYRHTQYASLWLWQWDGNSGNLTWFVPKTATTNQAFVQARVAPDVAWVNYLGPIFATNFASDVRFKTNIVPMTYDISTLMALNVYEFDWLKPDGTVGDHDCGLLAHEVQAVYSEPIMKMGIPAPDGTGDITSGTPTLGLRDGSMIALLVKCMQTVSNQINSITAGAALSTFEYTFIGTTTAPPASGQVRFNDVQATATHVFIHNVSAVGIDRSLLLASVKNGSTLIIQDKDDASKAVKYSVTASTAGTGYYDFTVTLIQNLGVIPAQRVMINIIF